MQSEEPKFEGKTSPTPLNSPDKPHADQPGSRRKARGTAAMDAETRQEVARKGGLAVSKNKQHMAEIGRKGGMAVSRNREHMAAIGRKGGEASRKSKVQPGLTTQAPQTATQERPKEEAV